MCQRQKMRVVLFLGLDNKLETFHCADSELLRPFFFKTPSFRVAKFAGYFFVKFPAKFPNVQKKEWRIRKCILLDTLMTLLSVQVCLILKIESPNIKYKGLQNVQKSRKKQTYLLHHFMFTITLSENLRHIMLRI